MIDFYDATNGLTANVFVCGKQMYFDLANMLIDSGEQNGYRIGTAFSFPQDMFSDLTVIYNKNIPNSSDGKPQLIALNRENALNKFTAANSNISEMSPNIRNQTQLGTISEIVGFGKFLNEASRILKLA